MNPCHSVEASKNHNANPASLAKLIAIGYAIDF
jgi:hypothetical protein